MANSDIREIAATLAAAVISKTNFTGLPAEEAVAVFLEVLSALEKREMTVTAPEATLPEQEEVVAKEIYQSENGDRWLLCRNADGHAYIEHRANLPSGGKVTPIEISDFLGHGRAGPEHRALLGLIANSVDKIA